MAKEAYYFSHDYGARNDPKLQEVLMELGQEGKGVYWDLVEMLFEEGGKLKLDKCRNYAFALHTDINIIQSLINNFDLFEKDNDNFWSNSVLKRLKIREEKSEKAAESARKRWDRANAMQSECECNAIKERKGKEKKVKESKPKDIYINPTKDYFEKEYKKVFKTKPFLMALECNKLIELESDIDNFRDCIPIALEKLSKINFPDINFKPSASWLLRDNNFSKVMNGEFDTQEKTLEDKINDGFDY